MTLLPCGCSVRVERDRCGDTVIARVDRARGCGPHPVLPWLWRLCRRGQLTPRTVDGVTQFSPAPSAPPAVSGGFRAGRASMGVGVSLVPRSPR